MTKLIIARHGNTFGPEDTPTRVGARTDLSLVESGRAQAVRLGHYLKSHDLIPEITYSSQLKRTIETAEIALKQTGFPQPVYPLDIFNEIDYGVDENQTEDKVIARIGAQAIKDWDDHTIVPDGWDFDPKTCIKNWKNFAAQQLADTSSSPHTPSSSPHPPSSFGSTEGSQASIIDPSVINRRQGYGRQEPKDDNNEHDDSVVLVVTSNGIARFAPHITGNFEGFAKDNKIKLSTGALGIIEFIDNRWTVIDWNVKP